MELHNTEDSGTILPEKNVNDVFKEEVDAVQSDHTNNKESNFHMTENKEENIQNVQCDNKEQSMAANKAEKKKIMKNIIFISLAFLLNFTAYQGLARLQSSLHHDDGMGVINQSILYGCLVVSSFCLPKLIISLIGHKWTMPVCIIGYIVWMAANGYAVWETMIPASILIGFAAAPLWTAQSSYFTIAGSYYASLTGETEEAVVVQFFGIFFFFFQMCTITGSIISSAVLTPKDPDYVPDDWVLQYCGRNDCPDDNITGSGLNDPSETTVWVMVGTYCGLAVLAVIFVSVFVDPLPDKYVNKEKVYLKDILGLVAASARHLRHKEQLLLIPLTIYSGLSQAFFAAEFSASFVTCTIGIWKVGLVNIGFGVTSAIVSLASSRVAKQSGRLPLFLTGFLVDIAVQITLLTWMPHPREEYVLYILACLLGYADAIWQTQIHAIYGVLFVTESEAAFSNLRIWQSVGFIIGFAYSFFLCTYIKTFIVFSVLILGFTGYLCVEYGQMRRKKNKIHVNVTN